MKRTKKNKKVKRRGFLVKVIRFVVLVIVGVIYIVYFIIKGFHTLVGKGFMNLPRIARVLTIYAMLMCMGMGVLATYSQPKINYEVKAFAEHVNIPEIDFGEVKLVKAKTRPKVTATSKVCKKYSEIECMIFKKAKKHGLTTNQGYMLMAISKHETGNWSSSIFKNYHNMGGIIGSNGFRQYNSLDDGIEDFVNLLDNYYINNGRDTIELIGAKYCPVGASNDPTGLNQHWVPQVTKYYNDYTNK